VILLISASWIARITDVSHWHPAIAQSWKTLVFNVQTCGTWWSIPVIQQSEGGRRRIWSSRPYWVKRWLLSQNQTKNSDPTKVKKG
jgi:hypothetical protein